MTPHLPAALLPLLLALVQGLLLWALWSLRRSFVPQAEHLRCRREEQRREALWLRRLDLLEQALAQERELLTPLADEVRSLREDAGRLHSQLQAAEAGLFSGFLPALLLSGFVFDINSMPPVLQAITHLVPARYFNTCLRTLFLTGDVWELFWPCLGAMSLLALLMLGLVYKKLVKRLDV